VTLRERIRRAQRRSYLALAISVALIVGSFVAPFTLDKSSWFVEYWYVGLFASFSFFFLSPWLFRFANIRCHACDFRFHRNLLQDVVAQGDKVRTWNHCPNCGVSFDDERGQD
jgi:hypothetical protein